MEKSQRGRGAQLAGMTTLRALDDLFVAEAGYEVIVYEAGGLHQGVDDGGADESEAALLEVFAPCGGQRRYGGKLRMGFPVALERGAADKLPGISVKAAELLLHLHKSLGI